VQPPAPAAAAPPKQPQQQPAPAATRLPHPDELLGPSSGPPAPGGSKRPFTSVPGHSLPAAAGSSAAAKASKPYAAARPGGAARTGSGGGKMLLPPQLSGRCVCVCVRVCACWAEACLLVW
jgi:hypothetical protein